jgi:acyl dehydratase
MQLDLDVVGKTFEGPEFNLDWQRCALYALGIGAGTEALDFTWEGSPRFQVYPSFAVIPAQTIIFPALTAIRADYRTLVHGEQTIRLHKPFPTSGRLTSVGRIPAVYDKGKAAVVILETETRDAQGDLVAETQWSIFCRGQGGFGGAAGPALTLPEAVPGAAPAFSESNVTSPAQALLYRLSGDHNPLHVDPTLAPKVGFEAPILHGLCTYGIAARNVVQHLCDGDATRLRRFSARFSGVVYPGNTVDVRAVPSTSPGTWLVEARVGERSVLSHGVVEIG